MIGATLLCLFISLAIYGLILLKKKRQYFRQRGIKYLEPDFILGNTTDAAFGRLHPMEVFDRLYKAFPHEEVVGHYEIFTPMLIPRSPDLVDSILVKDFSYFHDRFTRNEPIETPSDASLFALSGNRWRALRKKFSPLFTSGKLRFMYHTISDCGDNLIKVLDEKSGQEVEMSDMLGLFAMDVIGSTAFGLEPNTLQNPESKFRIMGKKIFDGSIMSNITTMIKVVFPKIAKFFNIAGFPSQEASDYFFNIIRDALRYRKDKGLERNDFVQMLLTLKEKGKIEVKIREKGDEYLMIDEGNNDTYELELTDNILVGGAFTFLLAGFHSTANTLAYTLFELAQNPAVMEKAREEIMVQLKGNEPTYEDLKRLPYLEKVLKESLRLHPSAGALLRMCTKQYICPSGFVFNVGDTIQIPTYSLQKDPAYWPEPEVFNPDRFDTPPRPGTYMPFGDGPRICIAMRFAMVEMKFILVKLLMKYHFELSKKTDLPLKIAPRVLLKAPKGGITFRVTKIKS